MGQDQIVSEIKTAGTCQRRTTPSRVGSNAEMFANGFSVDAAVLNKNFQIKLKLTMAVRPKCNSKIENNDEDVFFYFFTDYVAFEW